LTIVRDEWAQTSICSWKPPQGFLLFIV